MIESSQWRLPVRRVESQALRGVVDVEGSSWSQETTVERFRDKLFGGIGCAEYSSNGRFLAISSRGQSLVLRLPLQSEHERVSAGISGSNCVWNEQLPRTCFTTRFRADEKLALQTVDKRVIVRSTETAFERNFDGHTRDVRDAVFLTAQHVASVSDDATVRLWSLTQTSEIAISAGAHTDYVRSACVLSERQFATGGYDRVVHLWDVRSDMRNAVMTFQLGYPVEKVCHDSNNSNLLFVAAADVVTIFDIRKTSSSSSSANQKQSSSSQNKQKKTVDSDAEGEEDDERTETSTSLSFNNTNNLPSNALFSGSFHTKTVSALAVHSSTNNGNITLLTGSLDKRIKVHRFDPSQGTLKTIATRKVQTGGVTALAIHPDGNQFCVGTQDGYASAIDVHEDTDAALGASKKAGGIGAAAAITADRGVSNQAGKKSAVRDSAAAIRKERAIATWLKRVHALLARFRYGLALKTALYSKFPDVITTTLDELQRRCALHVAVSGHNDRTIVQLLRFASDNVSDPKLTNTCLVVMDRIFEVYASVASESEYFHRELLRCHHLLEEFSTHVEHIRASTAIMELLCQ